MQNFYFSHDLQNYWENITKIIDESTENYTPTVAPKQCNVPRVNKDVLNTYKQYKRALKNLKK